MKHPNHIKATLLEMKTEKTLRMLKLMSMLQAQEAELREAFEFFDKDKSGFIDKAELRNVLQSLGTTLTDEELATLYVQMDPSGDGNIDFDEFVSVMAQDPSDKQSPAEVAIAIFSVLDGDKSGHIKTSELKTTLLGMDAGLSNEDIDETMLLFDKNRSGDITKHEFVQTLELLNTFS